MYFYCVTYAPESSQIPLGVEANKTDGQRSATTCLLLPGKMLDLKVLIQKRTFRNSGNKSGAVQGFKLLQENGLGAIITSKINRGASMVQFFNYAN